MKIIIFYRIGKKVCIEQINKLPCIKKRFKCITVWNSKTLNANYLSKKKINSSLIRCTLLTRWEQTMKIPGKQWYKITLRNLMWSHLAKNTEHYQFLWFILQFRRNYLLEYSVCFNKVSHKYYFSFSIVLCWTMLKPLFFYSTV